MAELIQLTPQGLFAAFFRDVVSHACLLDGLFFDDYSKGGPPLRCASGIIGLTQGEHPTITSSANFRSRAHELRAVGTGHGWVNSTGLPVLVNR